MLTANMPNKAMPIAIARSMTPPGASQARRFKRPGGQTNYRHPCRRREPVIAREGFPRSPKQRKIGLVPRFFWRGRESTASRLLPTRPSNMAQFQHQDIIEIAQGASLLRFAPQAGGRLLSWHIDGQQVIHWPEIGRAHV